VKPCSAAGFTFRGTLLTVQRIGYGAMHLAGLRAASDATTSAAAGRRVRASAVRLHITDCP
jgi:hypothetical protein